MEKTKERELKIKFFYLWHYTTQESNEGCTLILYLWKYFILITLSKALIKYLPKRERGTNRTNTERARTTRDF